jgi:hypothetical protein
MTLFVVAFFVIAALVLLLWLLVRPLADEASAVREEATPSVFGVEDRGRFSHNVADADASDSSAFVAEERQRRPGHGIGRSLES